MKHTSKAEEYLRGKYETEGNKFVFDNPDLPKSVVTLEKCYKYMTDFAEEQNKKNNISALRERIEKLNQYQTPEELHDHCQEEYGLDYEESLEMAYENMQTDASILLKLLNNQP